MSDVDSVSSLPDMSGTAGYAVDWCRLELLELLLESLEREGVSQEVMCERAGVRWRDWAMMLEGQVVPGFDVVVRLARAAGVREISIEVPEADGDWAADRTLPVVRAGRERTLAAGLGGGRMGLWVPVLVPMTVLAVLVWLLVTGRLG